MDLKRLEQLAIERTWALHQLVYKALDDAIERTRLDFETQPYDPWLFTHLVRYRVCQALDAQGAEWFTRTRLALSGIEVKHQGCTIKVWCGSEAELPAVGNSSGRDSFMSQPQLDNYIEALGDDDLVPMNLVIQWEHAGMHLSRVDLVCPKSFDSKWEGGDEWFRVPIPHPARQVAPAVTFTTEPEELEIEVERRAGIAFDERR